MASTASENGSKIAVKTENVVYTKSISNNGPSNVLRSNSFSGSANDWPIKGILKRKCFSSRSISECNEAVGVGEELWNVPLLDSVSELTNSEADVFDENSGNEQKTVKHVRFNDRVRTNLYRPNTSILGRREKNRKRGAVRRRKASSEGDESSTDTGIQSTDSATGKFSDSEDHEDLIEEKCSESEFEHTTSDTTRSIADKNHVKAIEIQIGLKDDKQQNKKTQSKQQPSPAVSEVRPKVSQARMYGKSRSKSKKSSATSQNCDGNRSSESERQMTASETISNKEQGKQELQSFAQCVVPSSVPGPVSGRFLRRVNRFSISSVDSDEGYGRMSMDSPADIENSSDEESEPVQHVSNKIRTTDYNADLSTNAKASVDDATDGWCVVKRSKPRKRQTSTSGNTETSGPPLAVGEDKENNTIVVKSFDDSEKVDLKVEPENENLLCGPLSIA